MKNALLKNININKLSKNEYDVYNTLQKYICEITTIIYNY